MDFKRYVANSATKKGDAPAKHYIGPFTHGSDDWNRICKLFGTSSPKELAQIVTGLVADLDSGTLRLVAGKDKGKTK
jgi:hypothetical protein